MDPSYQCVGDEEDPAQPSSHVFEWALSGNTAALEHLGRLYPKQLSMRDVGGASAMHYATVGRCQRAMQLIIKAAGAQELDAQDVEGSTSLHWAVDRNLLESCEALLSLGANPNILNATLMSPLHLAVSLKHNTLLSVLLSNKNIDINLQGNHGNTAVMLACSIDNCEALSILFRHGAVMCRQNKLGHFAIHAAAFAGSQRAMEAILKRGEEMGHTVEAHINYADKSFSSPLHLAVRGGNIDVINLCIAKGAKIDQQQSDKSTALHLACTQGALEVVKLMLSAYDRVEDIINITDGALHTPLHRATIFDHMELAEFLILKGADINCIDCKGNSPLLLATSCQAWRTVNVLLSHGADLKIKDNSGCNFLHLAVLQPKGLKNLSEDILQLDDVKALLSEEDQDGCTPLHYACRLGILDSVKNMLGLNVSLGHKSKEKKSALHFAAEYGRINTCQRLLENMTDTKLLNEGDESGMTPLHLASRGGHFKVVQLLLRKGALFHSDYKGWTCLHHAAAEGYTQTMTVLLGSNIKLLDRVDEDGVPSTPTAPETLASFALRLQGSPDLYVALDVSKCDVPCWPDGPLGQSTALHVAARGGQAQAVKLLLNMGAQMTLNKSDASFLHEAVHHGRKEVTNVTIESDRCEEALTTFKLDSAKGYPVISLIENLPESFKFLLDTCVKESEDDPNSHNYSIEYDFQWLQAPVKFVKQDKQNKARAIQPLWALNTMVHFNRIELLTHPVCKKYLEMKWNAYGIKAHLLNLSVYCLGLLPLSYLIVTMKPTYQTSPTANGTNVTMTFNSNKSFFATICMFLVLAMNLYVVGKEVIQISRQRCKIFQEICNGLDWQSAIFSLVFVIALLLNSQGTFHWRAGAWGVLASWINFLLYLQRFEHFGIYVVMFREIMRTFISIIILFFFLMLAFALAFYALMVGQKYFNRLELSVMQTFVMMAGEINYQDNFLEPYLKGNLPFPYDSYILFVWFLLMMPILLMNLLIGLAVGDIAEVQKDAVLKRIAMQIDLHTNLEEKMPHWFMKRVDRDSIVVYPNRTCKVKNKAFWLWGKYSEAHSPVSISRCQLNPVEQELNKQKNRLKQMSRVLENQHSLLKLIIQKMEIVSEAEESDGPQQFRDGPAKNKVSKSRRWGPVLKAVMKRNDVAHAERAMNRM